jgi:formylglycine-generating enzyme
MNKSQLTIILFFIIWLFMSCSLNKKNRSNSKQEMDSPNQNLISAQFNKENMVLIEGGTFVMGHAQNSANFDWGSLPHRVTVSSFYMDRTEVTNIEYRSYLEWLKSVYSERPEIVEKAKPDQTVWRRKLAYNEPFVDNYFTHLGYSYYPVVGVSWDQAVDYCKWRTDRINERTLIDSGYLLNASIQKDISCFKTENYINDIYIGNRPIPGNKDKDSVEKKASIEKGIFSTIRLPTEAEWEFAALGLIENIDGGELYLSQNILPWKGYYFRNTSDEPDGNLKSNFIRGRGDLKGFVGMPNDKYDIQGPVNSFEPNDFGLYCMSGNVNEWVLDVYRDVSPSFESEFRTFRGNYHSEPLKNSVGLNVDRFGNIKVDSSRITDLRNYHDGDSSSNVVFDRFRKHINQDSLRVYKGGSWNDRGVWLYPGSRRGLEQDKSLSDLGFRCVMDKYGFSKKGKSKIF